MLIKSTILAYIGPGLGLGAIGTITMMLFGFLVMILSIIIYPVKVFIKKLKSKKDSKI